MKCRGFHLYYLIRYSGIGFNICLGKGLCLCHWIFTGAVQVKILSLSSFFVHQIIFCATTTGNWHQSNNYIKVLFVVRLEGTSVCVCMPSCDSVCVCVSFYASQSPAKGLSTHSRAPSINVLNSDQDTGI